MNHIYIFNEGTRAAIYGVGTYINQMIECLSNIPEVMLNVVYLYSEKMEYCVENKKKYIIHHIPSRSIISRNGGEKYYRNAFYILASNIVIDENDKLIFHLNYHHEAHLISLLRSKWNSCLIYFTIHYQEWCFKFKGNDRMLKNMIKNNRNNEILMPFNNEKYIYENVDRIICLSKYTEDILKNVYKIDESKINVIYNGLENIRLFPDSKRIDIKRKLFFEDSEKIILFVGRLDEIKGVDFLIDAFKKALKEDPSLHLVIIGDGDFSRYFSKSVGYWKKITFTGRLEKKLLYEFYQIADVGVMPSFHEQCSFVAIEMMMCGLPLITSDSTGLKEMQVDKKLMIKVIDNDDNMIFSADEIAEKIITVIKNGKSCYKNKYETHINRYNIDTMLQHICNFY